MLRLFFLVFMFCWQFGDCGNGVKRLLRIRAGGSNGVISDVFDIISLFALVGVIYFLAMTKMKGE